MTRRRSAQEHHAQQPTPAPHDFTLHPHRQQPEDLQPHPVPQPPNKVIFSRATVADASEMVICDIAANADDLFVRQWESRPAHQAELAAVFRDLINRHDGWAWVARDDVDGSLLGYALWVVVRTVGEAGAASRGGTESHLWSWLGSRMSIGEGDESDVDRRRREFMDRVVLKLDHYVKGRRYLLLAGLAVSPLAQRGGIGSQLMQLGIDRADKDGDTIFLNSSPAAHEFYLHRGFVEIDGEDVDLGEWYGRGKGYGVWRMGFKIRLPAAKALQAC